MIENNNKLIKIIKESNLIVIYGTVGRGKNLLLNKLSQHPELKGNVYTGNFKLEDLPTKGNIYITNLDLAPFALPSPNPSENEKQIQNWQQFLSNAKHNQQKIFFTIADIDDLWIKTRDLADLIIQTRGVSAGIEKNLSFLVKKGEQQWEEKINISTQDLANHANRYEYLNIKRNKCK